MARFSVFCLVAVVLVCGLMLAEAASYDCPPSGQHTNCSNKCQQDHECASMGGKCCPSLCNYKSCVIPKAANGSNGGYKGSSSGGAYCGNVKCSPFEKCGIDRTTKRMACVRA